MWVENVIQLQVRPQVIKKYSVLDLTKKHPVTP